MTYFVFLACFISHKNTIVLNLKLYKMKKSEKIFI